MRRFILALAALAVSPLALAQKAPDSYPGGVYNATAPTLADKQSATLQSDANGNLKVSVSPSPSSVIGIAPSVAGSSSSNTVVKASAGNLYGAYVTTGATAGYLMVFNATSAPSNGATTAGIASGNLQECVVAPANTTTSISYIGAPPEVFTTGVTLVFSSTGCGTLTASATAYLHGSAF